MSVDLDAASRAPGATRTGTVTAVCYSKKLANGIVKDTHESIEITRWGVPGDHHYGETRWSGSARRAIPNNRPITVVGVEATRDVCAQLGIPDVPPGGLGENLQVEGLGDLSDLKPGDQLRVLSADGETQAVLEVRKQNEPCANLQVYHREMTKLMFGRRGVICTVLQEGTARRGDRIELVRS